MTGVVDVAPRVVQAPPQKTRRVQKAGVQTVVPVVGALVELVKGADGGLPADAPVAEGHVLQITKDGRFEGTDVRCAQAPLDRADDVVETVGAA